MLTLFFMKTIRLRSELSKPDAVLLYGISPARITSIAWLTERVNERELHPQYVDTSKQASDIFTKSFTNLVKWMSALQLLGMVYDVKAFEAVHIPME